ncbi:MAG: 2'-5' RNA ligase family protein [Limnochordia bacterium]|nr:2'-5' RNA ligase family protein [Limnochordia bacterium]
MRVFLGLRLPQELEELCERYRRSFKAPKTVAHITVVPPFVWETSAPDLIKMLEVSLLPIEPLQVTGAGIGSFGNRVLFINVTLTPELEAMQRVLSSSLAREGTAIDSRPYNPHISLATRLDARQFARYSRELGDFHPEVAFLCSHLSVFQFSEERRWDECWRLPL